MSENEINLEKNSQPKLLKNIDGVRIVVDRHHIERHFPNSGVLGASITRWKSVEEMISDHTVIQFLNQSIKNFSKSEKIAYFHLEFPETIGLETIVVLSELPTNEKIWQEEREGYKVNVTSAKAPNSNILRVTLTRQKGNPGSIIIKSIWCSNIKSPGGRLNNPEWEKYAFYNNR